MTQEQTHLGKLSIGEYKGDRKCEHYTVEQGNRVYCMNTAVIRLRGRYMEEHFCRIHARNDWLDEAGVEYGG